MSPLISAASAKSLSVVSKSSKRQRKSIVGQLLPLRGFTPNCRGNGSDFP
jgi:hypothetical protein